MFFREIKLTSVWDAYCGCNTPHTRCCFSYPGSLQSILCKHTHSLRQHRSIATPFAYFDAVVSPVACYAAKHRKAFKEDLHKLDITSRRLLRFVASKHVCGAAAVDPHVPVHNARRINVVCNGLPSGYGAQLAVDASPQARASKPACGGKLRLEPLRLEPLPFKTARPQHRDRAQHQDVGP